jgi:hypothetical protein
MDGNNLAALAVRPAMKAHGRGKRAALALLVGAASCVAEVTLPEAGAESDAAACACAYRLVREVDCEGGADGGVAAELGIAHGDPLAHPLLAYLVDGEARAQIPLSLRIGPDGFIVRARCESDEQTVEVWALDAP